MNETAIQENPTAFIKGVMQWAEIHIGNGDPRCAVYGDWSKDGWTKADEGGQRCDGDGCIGCGNLMLVEHLQRAIKLLPETTSGLLP